MKTGKSGGATRSLALTSRPEGGSIRWGSASPEAKPVQSAIPLAPSAGRDPSPEARIGTRPVTNRPMPVPSATIRFCTGAEIMAAACPASATVWA